jgi:hypothetical protein
MLVMRTSTISKMKSSLLIVSHFLISWAAAATTDVAGPSLFGAAAAGSCVRLFFYNISALIRFICSCSHLQLVYSADVVFLLALKAL